MPIRQSEFHTDDNDRRIPGFKNREYPKNERASYLLPVVDRTLMQYHFLRTQIASSRPQPNFSDLLYQDGVGNGPSQSRLDEDSAKESSP